MITPDAQRSFFATGLGRDTFTVEILVMALTPTPAAATHISAQALDAIAGQLPQLSFDATQDPAVTAAAREYLRHYNLPQDSKPLQDSQRPAAQNPNPLAKEQLAPPCIHRWGTLHTGNYTIACHYWHPVASARGTVFLVHGYFDHVGLYGHLVRYLLARDYSVVAFDLPGHGLSSGERVSIASFDHYADVFDAVLQQAATHLPRPWNAVGQSTGGAIILKYLLEHRDHRSQFTQIALLAPLIHPYRWAWNKLVYLAAHRFIGRIGRKFVANSGNRAFLQFLSGQDPLQDRYIPLEWIGAMKHWTETFRRLPTNPFPVCIVQGDQDTTLDWRYNLKALAHKFPNAKIHIVPGARHHLANETPALRNQVFAAMGL